MSVYYIASLKISHFIAQNLGNKAKPRGHDPPGYFRSQKYPGYRYEVEFVFDAYNASLAFMTWKRVSPKRSWRVN